MSNKINYLLRVSYDGSCYFGSQKQLDKPTVESELKKGLEKYFKLSVPLTISSRTDKGVHALDHPMLIKLPLEIDVVKTARNLNWILPDDISVNSIEKVDAKFHPRYHSKEKTYRYVLSSKISVFDSRYTTYYRNQIDIEKLNDVVNLIVGKHDFVNFTSKNPRDDYVREVTNIEIKKDGDNVVFYVSGTGFLRYMVRNIIACFLEYNEDTLTIDEIKDIIDVNRTYTFKRVDPNGLCLYNVKF